MSETALKILRAAHMRIYDPRYWGKGMRNIDRNRNTYCAGEAIEAVSAPDASRRLAYKLLDYAIGSDGNLVYWNDHPYRTHAEVLAAFNLAIALARNMPSAP